MKDSLPFPDGWAKDDLIYQWKEKDPVQVVPGLHLPRFTLEQYKSAYCDVTTNTGKERSTHTNVKLVNNSITSHLQESTVA